MFASSKCGKFVTQWSFDELTSSYAPLHLWQDGKTPLLLACFGGYNACVAALAEGGADVNTPDKVCNQALLLISDGALRHSVLQRARVLPSGSMRAAQGVLREPPQPAFVLLSPIEKLPCDVSDAPCSRFHAWNSARSTACPRWRGRSGASSTRRWSSWSPSARFIPNPPPLISPRPHVLLSHARVQRRRGSETVGGTRVARAS